jgi:hypothetical protein
VIAEIYNFAKLLRRAEFGRLTNELNVPEWNLPSGGTLADHVNHLVEWIRDGKGLDDVVAVLGRIIASRSS